jgi:hypothetical protein
MIRIVRLAAFAAPVFGLAALWALSEHTYHQGTEWDVPIQGYDPRDYLRGHYVEFTYDWPGMDELRDAPPLALCMVGERPNLARVQALDSEAKVAACDHPVRADASGVYGWEGLTRGRLYLGQDRAAALDKQLRNRDQRGIVTIRQREDAALPRSRSVSARSRPRKLLIATHRSKRRLCHPRS